MSETQFVPYPTSKITSLIILHEREGFGYAICEDGSVWEFLAPSQYGKGFKLLFAPPGQPAHEKDTLAWDLNEALDVIESMMTNPDNDFQPTFGWDILKKHGRIK